MGTLADYAKIDPDTVKEIQHQMNKHHPVTAAASLLAKSLTGRAGAEF